MENEEVEEALEFTEEDRETAWEVNALLTALHEGSVDLYESILTEAKNLPGLLVMANATLKTMVDFLLDVVNEAEGVMISFPDLIRMSAEFLTSIKTTE